MKFNRRHFVNLVAGGAAASAISGLRGQTPPPQAATVAGQTKALVFDTFGTVVDWRNGVAREAERTVENSASRPIAADPNQSEAVQTLRHEQQRVFKREERDQQRQIDLENQARLHHEEEQRRRGEHEAEGESM